MHCFSVNSKLSFFVIFAFNHFGFRVFLFSILIIPFLAPIYYGSFVNLFGPIRNFIYLIYSSPVLSGNCLLVTHSFLSHSTHPYWGQSSSCPFLPVFSFRYSEQIYFGAIAEIQLTRPDTKSTRFLLSVLISNCALNRIVFNSGFPSPSVHSKASKSDWWTHYSL